MSATRTVFGRTLYPGTGYTSPSPSVRCLQRALARSGYDSGPIDGRFGPFTERALVRYQADRGLQVDGIAGPRTQMALRLPGVLLYPGAGYDSLGSRFVRILQRLLARSGYALGAIDGRFGPFTERALLSYQADHRLRVDGIAGPQVFGHLAGSIRPRRLTVRRVGPVRGSTKSPAAQEGVSWILIALVLIFGLLGLRSVLFAALPSRRGRSEEPVPLADSRSDTGSNWSETTTSWGAPLRVKEVPRSSRATPAPIRARERIEAERFADIADISCAFSDTNVAFHFGVLLEEHGDLSGAEDAYRFADQRGHGAAACNLGVLLERRGDRVGALGAYRRADARGEPHGTFNLGVLEGQNDVARAEAANRRADQRGHAEILDFRGREATVPAPPVLADPSGRRARLLAHGGRVLALVALLWVAGLVLAGLGILPAGDAPLGRAVAGPQAPSGWRLLPKPTPPTAEDLSPAAPAGSKAASASGNAAGLAAARPGSVTATGQNRMTPPGNSRLDPGQVGQTTTTTSSGKSALTPGPSVMDAQQWPPRGPLSGRAP